MNRDFEVFDSRTYAVRVGCGMLFITVLMSEGCIVKVITHRKSAFECDLTFFDALNRQTSFITGRELEQAIEDLQGIEGVPNIAHFCKNYSIVVRSHIKQGKMGAYSCPDAVARVLNDVIKNCQETKEEEAREDNKVS